MILVITYALLFTVNSLIFYLANSFFSEAVVIGTHQITMPWAFIHFIGTLTLINTFIVPFVREVEIRRGKMFQPSYWMLLYLVVNFMAVWGLTRFPEQLGIGISSWLVILSLAVALDITQGLAMMQLEQLQKQ